MTRTRPHDALTLFPCRGMLDRFAAVRRFAEHVRERERLGLAPYERVITLATRAMLEPWDQVLTAVALANGAAQ